MPTRIGKYDILRRLGQGAMGEVFLARDPLIGREVAIKTIAPAQAQGEEARERFLREARAAGQLSHPNLVTIHEFGEDQGLLYLVMEYVPGEDLLGLMAVKALHPREILEILAQVCDGLAYAHGKGVLHRDIKPGNIRVARPGGRLQAKVMDFGIARITGSDLTGTGTLLGTFGYMAPEYIQTGHPDPRSDLFAVGVILYEALAGQRPFTGETTATLLYRVVHEPPAPLDPKALAGISPAVGAVLAMALAKDPEDRHLTAEAMAANLRACMDPAWHGVGIGAKTIAIRDDAPPTVPIRLAEAPAAPRRRAALWLGAGCLLVAGAAGAVFWPRRPAAPAQTAPAASPPVPAPRSEAAPAAGVKPEPAQPAAAAPAPKSERPTPARPVEARPDPAPQAPPRPALASLDEAVARLDREPRAALAFLDRLLAEDPAHVRAWGLKLVAHYELDDFDGCRATLREAGAQGVPFKAMLMVPRVRQMLKQEANQPKLPPELRGLLREGAGRELPRKRFPLRDPRF